MQQTRVAVVNHLASKEKLEIQILQDFFTRKFPSEFVLKNFVAFDVSGSDAFSFLNGQATNDLTHLKQGEGQLSSFIDIKGQVSALFYAFKNQSGNFFLLAPPLYLEGMRERFKKYIIADDVTVVEKNIARIRVLPIFGETVSKEMEKATPYYLANHILGPSCFILESDSESDSESDYNTSLLCTLTGFPDFNQAVPAKLANELSYFNLIVDLQKGCFLGKEIVNKIESRRKSAYKESLVVLDAVDGPVNADEMDKIGKVQEFVTLDGISIARLGIFRDYRISGRKVVFNFENKKYSGEIIDLPLPLTSKSHQQWAQYTLYHAGQLPERKHALQVLKASLQFLDGDNLDLREAYGVLLGQEGRYEDALLQMDEILQRDKLTPMAHTNKSRFYMLMGDKDRAEAEKSKAMTSSFELNAKMSRDKKEKAQADQMMVEKRTKRKGMYQAVLNLDADDTMANLGLADILVEENDWQSAKVFFEKVLATSPKSVKAYLGLGKILLREHNSVDARKILEDGVKIAAGQGDFSNAKIIQELLKTITLE
jgi:folate-binding Fe-S cluster repair protein YgfZ/Tfp pilus assembly protein PilF